ncbi:MAG: hypothetical protein V2I54_03925 [Bacteroidales bacterium]|jgi:hypothetical protein|nr:hypothetical protein [Bacteroidales bacterium]
MKKIFIFITIVSLLSCSTKTTDKNPENNYLRQTAADTVDATNDFYDNAETHELAIQPIQVEGEIDNPGTVDFSKLPVRSVIVKETLLSGDGDQFVGAYRYDGYALYDILNQVKLNKKNKDEFNPIIDLYVQVENEQGEKVNISWGELYYPNHLQEIIIATRVMRIVPSKTNDLWPLPQKSKLIVSTDLITERNISNPVKITVKSYPKSFPTVKGLKPLFSPKIDIFNENKLVETITENPEDLNIEEFHTIFYGRGRGIHSTQPFTGVMLKEVLGKHVKMNRKNIREGIFLVTAKDGYRGVFTFSEVMNRNDQSEILLVCQPEVKDDGIFRLFPACDFFSDRAIKGITEIYFSANEQ